MAYVPAGSLCLLRLPPASEPAPLGTVPELATAGAVRAGSVRCDGLLQVAAIHAEARVPPERAQGYHLVRLGQRLASVPFLGSPRVGNADASHHA